MMSSGLLGLFVGPVVLSLGYKVFQAWLINDAPVSKHSGLRDKINVDDADRG